MPDSIDIVKCGGKPEIIAGWQQPSNAGRLFAEAVVNSHARANSGGSTGFKKPGSDA